MKYLIIKRINNQFCSFASARNLFVAIATGITFLSAVAQAQNNLSITFRPTANFPMKDLGETKLGNGGGFEATVSYSFMPYLGAYAGWGINTFNEKETSTGTKNKFHETGYTFGLHFIHPFSPESKLNYLLSAGGVYNHIEAEDKDDNSIYDTNFGMGWQAEAGLSIPVGHHNRWHLAPTVRYRSLSRDITMDGIKTNIDLNYVSVGLGVSWTIWSAAK